MFLKVNFQKLRAKFHQIDELKSDITLLTSEAELHKQEVEAEFEDRLAAYEDEVLHLKHSIESLKSEKLTLEDEITATNENVRNLKKGIQSMHEAHRDYLNKVMRAVENANREHRLALSLVQKDKEKQIKDLLDEVSRLQLERNDVPVRTTSGEYCTDRIYQLARKIEKVTSPVYVAALAKKVVRKITSKEEYIEEKLSGIVRQLLYKLEDVAAAIPNTPPSEDEHVLHLQQQLTAARAKIEKLERCSCGSGND
jgi:phage host-nuclease inhibitor protein Gam